jgi:hypothetical protein
MLTFFTDTKISDISWALRGDARSRRVIHEAGAYENEVDGRSTGEEKKVAEGDGGGEATDDAKGSGDGHDNGEDETEEEEEAVDELVHNISGMSI